jgi:SRSO17 transposase
MAEHQLAHRNERKPKAPFAAVRVRVADGPPQRIRDKGQQHLPGDEAWLIGEHRMSGEKKYYLANLPAKTDLRTLAATIKARWICEQAHQQMKEELGLDHFERRSWQGLNRHALMTMIAYAFHARIVENGFAASSGVSKSAKVVLGTVSLQCYIRAGKSSRLVEVPWERTSWSAAMARRTNSPRTTPTC